MVSEGLCSFTDNRLIMVFCIFETFTILIIYMCMLHGKTERKRVDIVQTANIACPYTMSFQCVCPSTLHISTNCETPQ